MKFRSNSINSIRYRPEIDGLRAFAVIAVIINHFNKDILPGGYLGVDIFFVISGFVITSSLYKKNSKNFRDFLSSFYERRIKRLLPNLLFFVLTASVLICLFHENHILSLRTGFSSIFGLSNLYLIKQTTNYFAESTELNVFAHTWSLGVEEQFYFFFPFLTWISGFSRNTNNGERNLSCLIGILSLASFMGYFGLYSTNQAAAYFLMPTRFWEISFGCLTFLLFKKKSLINNFLKQISPTLILTIIVFLMYLPENWGSIATFAIVVFSSTLLISLGEETQAFEFFTKPKVVFIGLISYSLYLWHWGVLAISRWTIGIHWWSIPFQVLLIFILSFYSYKWIEQPLRKGGFLKKRFHTFLAAGGLISLSASSLFILEKPLKGKLFLGSQVINTEVPAEEYSKEGKCFEGISSIYTSCFFFDNNSNKSLWVIGDSHAAVLRRAAEETANNQNMNLKLISSAGTPFPHVKNLRKIKNNNNFFKRDKFKILKLFLPRKEEFNIRNNDFKILEEVIFEKVNKGDVILIAIRLPLYFGGLYYEKPAEYLKNLKDYGSFGWQQRYFQEWISSVKDFANKLNNLGVHLVVQTPTPEWEREKNKFCNIQSTQWFNSLQKRDCKIDSRFFTNKKNGLYVSLLQNIRQLAISESNIHLLDSFSIVCPGDICNFSKNGIDLFQDDNHFSMEAAKQIITPSLSEIIKSDVNKKI